MADGGECTKGHKFKNFAAPQSFSCTHCGQNVHSGTYSFGCMDCDRDLCTTCYEDPKTRDSKGTAADRGVRAAASRRTRSIASKPEARRGTASLEVGGPVAPRPPPQLPRHPGAAIGVPDAADDNGEECAPGQHQFSHYPASSLLYCCRCNQQLNPGTYIYSCDECDLDLCETCYFFENSAMFGQASKKKAPAPQPELQTVPESNSVQPAQLAVSLEALARGDRGDERADRGRTADRSPSSPLARTGSGSSSPRGKECKFCGKPYTGHGITCAACRKSGPLALQCRECKTFFNGFGDLCEECRCTAAPTAFAF